MNHTNQTLTVAIAQEAAGAASSHSLDNLARIGQGNEEAYFRRQNRELIERLHARREKEQSGQLDAASEELQPDQPEQPDATNDAILAHPHG